MLMLTSAAPAATAMAAAWQVVATTTDKPRRIKWPPDDIRAAQRGLERAGYYRGKISGSFNRQTHRALRDYQRAHSLKVTGELTALVLTRLKLEP